VIFQETPLVGCHLVEPDVSEDDRGFFARIHDADELRRHGLDGCVAQSSISYNRTAATLRGLHYQSDPYAEAKLVRCLRGRVFDVVADIRPTSPTYGEWFSADLSRDNRLAIYIPAGLAHGFLTLTDHAEMLYNISAPYVAEASFGIRWDDPGLQIRWPEPPRCISDHDAGLPFLREVGPA
jgi:dTDP-4-dehydrorhamnose 3,5-epimerase